MTAERQSILETAKEVLYDVVEYIIKCFPLCHV